MNFMFAMALGEADIALAVPRHLQEEDKLLAEILIAIGVIE